MPSNKQLQRTVMNTGRQVLIFLALPSCCFAVGAQPPDPTRFLTRADWQTLDDEIALGVTHVEHGEVVGVRIARPGSLFKALDIEAGDVVLEVNGESLAKSNAFPRFVVELVQNEGPVRAAGGYCGNRRTCY